MGSLTLVNLMLAFLSLEVFIIITPKMTFPYFSVLCVHVSLLPVGCMYTAPTKLPIVDYSLFLNMWIVSGLLEITLQ